MSIIIEPEKIKAELKESNRRLENLSKLCEKLSENQPIAAEDSDGQFKGTVDFEHDEKARLELYSQMLEEFEDIYLTDVNRHRRIMGLPPLTKNDLSWSENNQP